MMWGKRILNWSFSVVSGSSVGRVEGLDYESMGIFPDFEFFFGRIKFMWLRWDDGAVGDYGNSS